METSATAQLASNRYTKIADATHTITVVAILGVWTLVGRSVVSQMGRAVSPDRVRVYVLTFLLEWLVFAFVVVGVRRSGAPLETVLGGHWQSARQVLRDIGIAAAFWIVSMVLLAALGWFLRRVTPLGETRILLPHGRAELALWFVLSGTAGICEETICRGYLQRQFMALTKSAPAGILLAAMAFGGLHAYQGFGRVIQMTAYGVMFGVLAHWRGSVRPGMIAHAWHDSLAGMLAGLLRF